MIPPKRIEEIGEASVFFADDSSGLDFDTSEVVEFAESVMELIADYKKIVAIAEAVSNYEIHVDTPWYFGSEYKDHESYKIIKALDEWKETNNERDE